MSITVTLDEDVLEKVKAESAARGTSVDGAINELLRLALSTRDAGAEPKRFEIKPFNSGPPPYNLDCIGRLLEEVEGPDWR